MIIESLLDTDLYKFTMQQVAWHRFSHAWAEYEFKNRSDSIDLRPFAEEIRAEIDHVGTLSLTDAEAAFLQDLRFIRPDYVEILRCTSMDPKQVTVESHDDGLHIQVAGYWWQAILWEVPILAIVNEVYFRNTQPNAPQAGEGERRLQKKIAQIRASDTPLRITEFGTRRRYSRAWQRFVVETLKHEVPDVLIGTSNVHLALELGLKPFGTMAHEFLQAGQAFAPLPDFQKWALEQWMQEYRGDLGIALSDIVGMDAFLRDFDLLFTKAYDGARHDSGDPVEWGEKLIAHYEKMNVDARTKTMVFSDGLTIPRCIELSQRFDSRIRTLFGVGTNLTNDLGFPALQIVLKMVRCNGRPVAKLSDSPGKAMAVDPVFVAYLRDVFGREDKGIARA